MEINEIITFYKKIRLQRAVLPKSSHYLDLHGEFAPAGQATGGIMGNVNVSVSRLRENSVEGDKNE